MNSNVLKYTIKIFLLIVTISFVFDKVIYFTFNKISDQVYTGQSIGKLNHYMKIKDDLDLIVYGNSRANHNINTIEIIKNSFNMGMDGRALAYSATLIKLLSTQKKQIILLHIDPNNAFTKSYSGTDILPLSTKYNRNKIIKEEINKLGQSNILQNFYWSLSYTNTTTGILKNYFKPNYDYKTYSGYDPIYVSKNQRKIFENILKRDKQELPCQDSLVFNKIYDEYLDELNSFCKKNNKTLIFFTSPIYKNNCNEVNIEFKKQMKNRNLTYYDLTSFFAKNNSIEYWKDNEHLSDKGAELFTAEIKILLSEHKIKNQNAR